MPEIKTDPVTIVVDDQAYSCFGEEHTLADIARWLLRNKSEAEEVVELIQEGLKEKSKSYPLGFWICTHSIFSDFKEGSVYECKLDQTGSPRIFANGGFSPYWSEHSNRFCYGRNKLDFKYIEQRKD